jgi:N-acyl-phosphatidylethanolamine-hydrolysing phospholipase D
LILSFTGVLGRYQLSRWSEIPIVFKLLEMRLLHILVEDNTKIFIFQIMRGPRFSNPHIQNIRRSLWDAILWKIGHYKDEMRLPLPPADFVYPMGSRVLNPDQPKAMWIGHSTYLIEVDGLKILTDPVWDQYCSPIPMKLFKRLTDPPIFLEDLPAIDLVLISHNHFDHLNAKTIDLLNRFHPQIHWVVPEALSPWFFRRGIRSVTELPRWKSMRLQQCSVTAVPTQHFSGRGLFDSNRTHWNGYVVETASKRLYFVGDTGYNPFDFKAIGDRFSHMDLSLIPIGTYSPTKFMETVHISPFEAVKIHKEVKSRLSLGMHWNTFRLSEEPQNRPPYDLYLSMEKSKLPFETFLPIEVGTYVNF